MKITDENLEKLVGKRIKKITVEEELYNKGEYQIDLKFNFEDGDSVIFHFDSSRMIEGSMQCFCRQ